MAQQKDMPPAELSALVNQSGPFLRHQVQRLSDDQIHSLLRTSHGEWNKGVLEQVLREREAWKSPAAWSLKVSYLALAVAIAAAVISLLK